MEGPAVNMKNVSLAFHESLGYHHIIIPAGFFFLERCRSCDFLLLFNFIQYQQRTSKDCTHTTQWEKLQRLNLIKQQREHRALDQLRTIQVQSFFQDAFQSAAGQTDRYGHQSSWTCNQNLIKLKRRKGKTLSNSCY